MGQSFVSMFNPTYLRLKACVVALCLGVSAPLGVAQNNVNAGALFVASGEQLHFADGLLQRSGPQPTRNQGHISVAGAGASGFGLHFDDGVVDQSINDGTQAIEELRAALDPTSSSWDAKQATSAQIPLTIFHPRAQSFGPSSILDLGQVDSLVEGRARSLMGQDFQFPLGDVDAAQVVYRGLLTVSGLSSEDTVDAQYFWRDGTSVFGTQLDPGLSAVSEHEFWKVWATDSTTGAIEATFEATSRIEALLGERSLDHLTLAGWNGQYWEDLYAQAVAGSDALLFGGAKTQRADVHFDRFQAYTFAVRDSATTPRLGVSKQLVEVLYDPLVLNRTILTFDFLVRNYSQSTVLEQLSLTDDLTKVFGDDLVHLEVLGCPTSIGSGLLTPNCDYSGLPPNIELLAPGNSLEPGQQDRIRLVVAVTLSDSQLSEYENSAVAKGRPPDASDDPDNPGDPQEITDTSTDGDDPDSDGDGNPSEDVPTPIVIRYPEIQIDMNKAMLSGSPVSQGERAIFLLEASNPTDLRVEISIVDFLPAGFVYEQDTALVEISSQPEVSQVNPIVDGQRLIWPNITLDGGGQARIQFSTLASVGQLYGVNTPTTSVRFSPI